MNLFIKFAFYLLILFLPLTMTAQEGNDKRSSNLKLSVQQGMVFYTENSVNANATGLSIELSWCDRFPELCPKITIDWLRIAARPDIWLAPPIIIRPWPLPLPPSDPWERFDICQLEFGPSNVYTTSLGIQRSLNDKLVLGVSGGIGFESRTRHSSTIGEDNFTVANMTNPVSKLDLSLSYSLSRNISIDLKGGMLNSYFGDLSVLADDGSSVVIEGFVANSPTLSLGVGFRI